MPDGGAEPTELNARSHGAVGGPHPRTISKVLEWQRLTALHTNAGWRSLFAQQYDGGVQALRLPWSRCSSRAHAGAMRQCLAGSRGRPDRRRRKRLIGPNGATFLFWSWVPASPRGHHSAPSWSPQATSIARSPLARRSAVGSWFAVRPTSDPTGSGTFQQSARHHLETERFVGAFKD